MNSKDNGTHDAFTISRGAANTRSSFALVPVLSDDRINRAFDERMKRPPEDQPDTEKEMGSFWGRFWMKALRRAA